MSMAAVVAAAFAGALLGAAGLVVGGALLVRAICEEVAAYPDDDGESDFAVIARQAEEMQALDRKIGRLLEEDRRRAREAGTRVRGA